MGGSFFVVIGNYCAGSLVIIDDLNIMGVFAVPSEAKPPLIVDPDRILPYAIADELLKTVAGRAKVVERLGIIQHAKLPAGDGFDALEPG